MWAVKKRRKKRGKFSFAITHEWVRERRKKSFLHTHINLNFHPYMLISLTKFVTHAAVKIQWEIVCVFPVIPLWLIFALFWYEQEISWTSHTINDVNLRIKKRVVKIEKNIFYVKSAKNSHGAEKQKFSIYFFRIGTIDCT